MASTLITVAPNRARYWVHSGPGSSRVKSSTRTPLSGPMVRVRVRVRGRGRVRVRVRADLHI